MSRLIDVHKVQMKLYEECQNIRHFDKDREKKQIFADGIDFAWVMLDNAPTVEAIPVEWIRNYVSIWVSEIYKNFVLNMIKTWEKENGKDSE